MFCKEGTQLHKAMMQAEEAYDRFTAQFSPHTPMQMQSPDLAELANMAVARQKARTALIQHIRTCPVCDWQGEEKAG